jgi:hypothetical protein
MPGRPIERKVLAGSQNHLEEIKSSSCNPFKSTKSVRSASDITQCVQVIPLSLDPNHPHILARSLTGDIQNFPTRAIQAFSQKS